MNRCPLEPGVAWSALMNTHNREKRMKQPFTRRDFFRGAVAGAGLAALGANAQTPAPKIAGFDETDTGKLKNTVWKPVSDRKVKVGIAGYGVCKFGAQFGFQNHPNVGVVAAADLDPERCAELAKATGAKKTCASCSEAGGVAAGAFAKEIFLGRPSFATPTCSLSGRESA